MSSSNATSTPSTQTIQIVGALLNMGAFALLHFEIAPSSALRYLIPNWLGSVASGSPAAALAFEASEIAAVRNALAAIGVG